MQIFIEMRDALVLATLRLVIVDNALEQRDVEQTIVAIFI